MQVAAPPLPPMPPVIVQSPEVILPPWMTLPPGVTMLVALGFLATTAIVLYPLMRALGRRLEGRAPGLDPETRAELDQLRERMAELEGMQHRMLELEERVDFAERLLSQRREAERLARGN